MGKKENHKSLILTSLYFLGKQPSADNNGSIRNSLLFAMSLLTRLIDENYISESGYALSGSLRPVTDGFNNPYLIPRLVINKTQGHFYIRV